MIQMLDLFQLAPVARLGLFNTDIWLHKIRCWSLHRLMLGRFLLRLVDANDAQVVGGFG
jgi:hypothetical protein